MENTRTRFEAFQWHDSEVRNIEIRQNADRWWGLLMDIVIKEKGGTEPSFKRFTFTDCWTFKTDLDFAFLAPSDGSVNRAQYVSEYDSLDESAKRVFKKDLYAQEPSVAYEGWFFFELLPPGGMILIGAEDFEVEDV